jgi:carotenoid cleavage dioxygenase
VLSDRPQEFPRHDERLVGRAHRFGYTTEFAGGPDGLRLGNVLRHDLHHGTTDVYEVGPGRAAMEPVFVPRHADAAEDDGWIMVYVHDERRDACDVEILAAPDLAAGPVATVHLPVRVPFGFHGNWMPAR